MIERFDSEGWARRRERDCKREYLGAAEAQELQEREFECGRYLPLLFEAICALSAYAVRLARSQSASIRIGLRQCCVAGRTSRRKFGGKLLTAISFACVPRELRTGTCAAALHVYSDGCMGHAPSPQSGGAHLRSLPPEAVGPNRWLSSLSKMFVTRALYCG